MTNRTRHLGLLLSLTTLSLTACVEDPSDLDTELGSSAASLVGWTTNSPEGAVLITRAGQPPRTGVLVGRDLVLTHSSVVSGAIASQLTVSWGSGTTQAITPEVRAGRHLNTFPGVPLALIQIEGDYVNGAREARSMTARSASGLNGVTVTCKAYNAAPALRRTTPVLSLVGTELSAPPLSGHVWEANDVGAPCSDGTELVGIVGAVDRVANRATLVQVNGIASWLANMKFLAQVRDDARNWSVDTTGPATLSFNAPNGTRMCLDVPWGWVHAQAAVNQYPCHPGDDKNQQVYIVHTNDAYQQIVFDHSGMCLNVPNGDPGAPVNLQQYPCHGTAWNERWSMALQPSGSGIRLAPHSAPTRSLGGQPGIAINTPSMPVQQQVTFNPSPTNQSWFITWKPVR